MSRIIRIGRIKTLRELSQCLYPAYPSYPIRVRTKKIYHVSSVLNRGSDCSLCSPHLVRRSLRLRHAGVGIGVKYERATVVAHLK